MSESKKIEDLNMAVFEIGSGEKNDVGAILKHNQDSSYSLISYEVTRLLDGKTLMTDAEFLDLIPVNGFFH